MAGENVKFNISISSRNDYRESTAKNTVNNPWIKRTFSAADLAKRENLQKSAEEKFEKYFA